MIPRHARLSIEEALARQAAVAVIGPRQVGKTTPALEIAQSRPAIYLDLEATADREKLSDPVFFLGRHKVLFWTMNASSRGSASAGTILTSCWNRDVSA